MRLSLLAALLALVCSCGSKKDPGSGSAAMARPSVADPLGFCDRASAMMRGRKKCFPEDTSIKMGIDSISELESTAPVDPEMRRHVAAECAVMLDGMMRSEWPTNCPLDVTDDERKELATFLAAWYGERTAAPKTGNADADAALATLAGQRDTACACKDLACARKAGKDFEDHLKPLPSDAPKEARDASGKMVDEITRCKQKLEFGPPAP